MSQAADYYNDGWTVTASTDFYNNQATKKAFEAIEWDDYSMSQFNFENLADMIDNDVFVEDLATRVRDSWMTYFKEEADEKLPRVCEPGKACRAAIYDEARKALKVDWELTLNEIQS
jgi:hypothetical protein